MTRMFSATIIIEKDADGYYAYCPQLQGCYTQGDTYEEVLENIKDAIQLHLEDRHESDEVWDSSKIITVTSLNVPISDHA